MMSRDLFVFGSSLLNWSFVMLVVECPPTPPFFRFPLLFGGVFLGTVWAVVDVIMCGCFSGFIADCS